MTGDLVQLLGHRVALHAQLGSGLVHQVDGLVREEALGDVAARQLHGCHDGLVLDAHLVVVLVALLESAKDRYAACLVGLVHRHRLEAAFQRLVLLEVFLVLVERGGTDGAQFATGQCRLQDVGCVHRTRAVGTGPDECVYLVDEEDALTGRLYHVVDHPFEAFLKLAFILGASDECTHVERVHLLALEVLGHVATQYAVGEALHDGCLARTGFAYQYRIVFRAATEYLEYTAYLLVTANHRVQLAVLCRLVEVDGKAVQEAVLLVLVCCKVSIHSL